jgi:hypothetical protein
MIELDANGNIPRKDERCQAYHVSGVDKGRPWSGFNLWSGEDYWRARIEAYDTFRGWATPEIRGDHRSSQPSEESVDRTVARLRFALCRRADDVQYLDMWNSEHGDSQADYAKRRSFVAWVSDTMEPLPPTHVPAPRPASLSEEVERIAGQTEPLTAKQQDLLRQAAGQLRKHGF